MASRDIEEPRGPIEDGERCGAMGRGRAIVAMADYAQRGARSSIRGP